MHGETPVFFTKPLTNKTSKKKPAKIKNKKDDKKDLSKSLNTIYQDDNGQLPNMQEIKIKTTHPLIKLLTVILIAGALLAAGAWAILLFYPTGDKYPDSKIILKLTGPTETVLDATSTYTLTYQNNLDAAIKNVTINTNYPPGFVFLSSSPMPGNAGKNEWSLGNIPARANGIITIIGKNYGEVGSPHSWRAFINYRPGNLTADLKKVVILNTQIDSSPISLAISGPDQTTVGSNVTYSFKVKTAASYLPPLLELAPKWPSNFSLASTTPALNKNGKWVVKFASTSPPSTAQANEQTFVTQGQFSSSTADMAEVTSALWLLQPALNQNWIIASTSLSTALAKNTANFNLAINGTLTDFDAQPGDIFNITLRVKNDSEQNFKNASVILTVLAPAIKKQSVMDWAEISDQLDGNILGQQLSNSLRQGQITWDYKKISSLARIKPNQEINIDLRLPIKDNQKINLSSLIESKIAITASLKYTDQNGSAQTVAANPINITLNSDLKFENRVEASTDPNNKEFNVTWVLNNTFHPLKNIELSADLFGDINWEMISATPPAGSVDYNIKTQKLIWRVAELPVSVDVLALPFKVTLNKLNPTQNTLISKVRLTAEDTVTGKKFDLLGDEVPLKTAGE